MINMELEHIREFLILAETGNYCEAANRLFISQSALFKHIKTLEGEIGVPLFIRSGNRIVISEFGKMFLPYAANALKLIDQFIHDVEVKYSEKSNMVLIGTNYRITELIAEFRQNNDKYLIRIVESGDHVDALFKDGCEIAFARNLEDAEGKYVSIPYAKDYLGVALYPSHPLAGRNSININELRHENFIVLSPERVSNDRVSNDHVLKLCEDAGFHPRIVLNAKTGSEVASLVARGLGIAVLNKKSTPQNGIKIIDLEPLVEYNITLCYPKNTQLSAAAKAFIDFVKNRQQGLSCSP
jgi:DNA-binding transcriptional LysR family regulator